MARKGRSAPRGRRGRTGEGEEALRLTPLTGIFGGVGLVVILLGYHLLNQGSINLAPVLLILGYLILIPIALVR